MEVELFMAMSVNGMVAKPDRSEDFLPWYGWKEVCRLTKEYKCLIWGRETLENAKRTIGQRITELEGTKLLVVSRNQKYTPTNNFIRVGSPKEATSLLADEGFKTALLDGGSTLNSEFAKAGLIDKIRINIEPWIIGQGFPLFAADLFELKLGRISTMQLPSGGIQITAKVL